MRFHFSRMSMHISSRVGKVTRNKCALCLLISDVLPYGALWYAEPNAVSNAVGYAKHRSRSHDAVIRVYDDAGNVIETHEHKGEFKEWWRGVQPVSSSFWS